MFSFYLLLSEINPKLKHKFSHRMEVKDPTYFSRKYEIDLILFFEKVINLLKFVRKTYVCGLLPFP